MSSAPFKMTRHFSMRRYDRRRYAEAGVPRLLAALGCRMSLFAGPRFALQQRPLSFRHRVVWLPFRYARSNLGLPSV